MFSRLFSRRLTVVALSLLVIAILATSFVQAQDEVTEIRFGTLSGAFIDAVNEMLVTSFEEAHPDINVNVEYVTGDYAGALTAQAAAGSLPDVVLYRRSVCGAVCSEQNRAEHAGIRRDR